MLLRHPAKQLVMDMQYSRADIEAITEIKMAREDAFAELISACEEENEEKIKALIARSGLQILTAKSNENSLNGGSALHYCAIHGKVRALDILLSTEGVAMDMKDNDNNTVLHVAANAGQVNALKVLLVNKNVKKLINNKNNDGDTALLLGVKREEPAVCEELLKEEKIDVEEEDADGWLAIHNAVARGFDEVVERLLKNKSCKQFVNKATKNEGYTPLHLAALRANKNICCKLLKFSSPSDDFLSSQDVDGDTALFFSVYSRQEEALSFFLKTVYCGQKNAKALLNVQNKKGETALHKALALLELKDYEKLNDVTVEWIDSPGVELDKKDKKGDTILHVACWVGQIDIVKKLLKSNAKLANSTNYAGMTPLHEAARACRENVVSLLLEENVYPRLLLLRDGDGRTALHCVAAARDSDDDDSETPKRYSEDSALNIAKQLLEKADKCDRKDVLLWASAGPVNGRAIDMAEESSPVKKYLQVEMDKVRRICRTKKDTHKIKRPPTSRKQNFTLGGLGLCSKVGHARNKIFNSQDNDKQVSLLGKALRDEDFDSVRDFLSRGAGISELSPKEKDQIMKQIVRKKSDQPTLKDSLGRMDLHKAIAALLLNPFTGTPLTIGILGKWGSGKSSTMLQVEFIILLTIAQSFLMKPMEMSQLPGVKEWKLTDEGETLRFEIVKEIKILLHQKGLDIPKPNYIPSNNEDGEDSSKKEQDDEEEATLKWFFEEEWQNHYEALKGLALADRTELVVGTDEKKTSNGVTGEIPAVLLVRFNAWLYENKEEASAGLALEVTRQMEQYMTTAQWLRARFYHACKRNRVFIYQKLVIPLGLFLVLGGFITWIVLKLLSTIQTGSKIKEFFYGSIPVSVIVILWTLFGNIFHALDPLSQQFAGYKISKEHEARLGHRQMVIDDICFLKKMICEKPGPIWKISGWMWKFFGHANSYIPGELRIRRLIPPKDHLRIVVFIDDLDRCKEDTYILDILRAINLVLAVCEINVVLGVDRGMVEKAIKNQFANTDLEKQNDEICELAEKFLQKIIQLPLDLPEPSENEMKNFLRENIDESQPALTQEKDSRTDGNKGLGPSNSDPEASTKNGNSADDTEMIIEIPNTDYQTDENTSLQPSNSDSGASTKSGNSEDGPSYGSRYPRAIEFPVLVAGYNNVERDAFKHLVSCGDNHPREWKHFLNYHRFACNVVSQTQSEKLSQIDGWRRQLIVWVFVCWRWKHQMNEIIQNWNDTIKALQKNNRDKAAEADPSLGIIVSQHRSKRGGNQREDGKKKLDEDEKKVDEDGKKNEDRKKAAADEEEKETEKKVDKEEKEKVDKEKEAKGWKSLRRALNEGYDVSMECIQSFQTFRFECKTGNLKWNSKHSQIGPKREIMGLED